MKKAAPPRGMDGSRGGRDRRHEAPPPLPLGVARSGRRLRRPSALPSTRSPPCLSSTQWRSLFGALTGLRNVPRRPAKPPTPATPSPARRKRGRGKKNRDAPCLPPLCPVLTQPLPGPRLPPCSSLPASTVHLARVRLSRVHVGTSLSCILVHCFVFPHSRPFFPSSLHLESGGSFQTFQRRQTGRRRIGLQQRMERSLLPVEDAFFHYYITLEESVLAFAELKLALRHICMASFLPII